MPARLPRRRAALAALVGALFTLSCNNSLDGVPEAAFEDLWGTYTLTVVNGDSVPTGVNTSYLQGGTVTGGLINVNTILDYQMTIRVRRPTGVQDSIRMRGYIAGQGPGRIAFVSHGDELQFEATWANRDVTVTNLRELNTVVFRRVGGPAPRSEPD
jgi:hypothetical protein